MNLLELVDQRNTKVDEMNTLINTGVTEKRKLNDVETINIKKLDQDIAEIDRQISEIQSQKSEINNRNNNLDKMENTRKSLIAEINERMAGKTDAINLQVEERAALTVAANGADVVGTDVMNILEPLREALVLVQAGAQFITGIKNDVKIPLYSGTNALWEGEVDEAADGAGTTAQVELSPKRLSAYVDISKKVLAQDSVGMENLILSDIVKAIAIKLQNTILGKEAGSATQPAGLFVSGLTVTGSTTFAKMVALETAVDAENALSGNLKYIVGSGAKGVLKTTPKIANSTYPVYIMDGNQMNGYEVLSTNSVAKNLNTNEFGVAFGNWNDLAIAQWGSIDLTVDPYSQATYGKVRIVINAYFDAAKRRKASFAVGSIK